MHRNPFWILFISAMVIFSAIYSGFAMVDIWKYVRLDKETEAQNIQWSVLSLSDDQFVPVALYQFTIQGKQYPGETRWQEGYLNEWSAKEAVARLTQSPPPVWYDGSNPEVSTLEKLFPFKVCLYSGSLWLLTLYFFGLGYYVKGKSGI